MMVFALVGAAIGVIVAVAMEIPMAKREKRLNDLEKRGEEVFARLEARPLEEIGRRIRKPADLPQASARTSTTLFASAYRLLNSQYGWDEDWLLQMTYRVYRSGSVYKMESLDDIKPNYDEEVQADFIQFRAIPVYSE